MSLPLVVHKDGTIYFYKDLSANDDFDISDYLKKTTVQVQYTDRIEIYKIEDYSIVSLLLMDSNSVGEFIDILNKYSYNEIPAILLKHIKEIEESMRVVSLTLNKAEIIINVMKGDLSFLNQDKKIKDKLIPGVTQNTYTYPRKDNYNLITYLASKDINMTFPSIDTDGSVSYSLREKINLRYYQEQAYRALINRKKGLTVMPSGSGKTYVGLKLMEYFKKVTLILCENKDNCIRWRDLILKHFDISSDDISVCVDESNLSKISTINIYSYNIIRNTADESIFDRLFENKWGLIIYDNAHKVVTEKAADLLYLKSTYKFAFDSTLSRSDGRQISLLNLFGGITYNISSYELVNNLFQKKLDCYEIDLRKSKISKVQVINHVLNKLGERSLLIAAYRKNDMRSVSANTGIRVINSETGDTDRMQWIKEFNEGKLRCLCIGNLIENYPITNVDVMIAAGYRGATEIEDSFRIGALVSTPSKLSKPTKSQMFYLVSSDKDEKIVRTKAGYLDKWGVVMKKLDISKYMGDVELEL